MSMAKQKLTPWFPATSPPAQVGVYETSGPDGFWFSYFNGTQWRGEWKTVERAFAAANTLHWSGPDQWRGLAEQPKGSAK
jgi:hypothetical protein